MKKRGVVPSVFKWITKPSATVTGRLARAACRSNKQCALTSETARQLFEGKSVSDNAWNLEENICGASGTECEPEDLNLCVGSDIVVESLTKEIGIQTESVCIKYDEDNLCTETPVANSQVKVAGPCGHDCGLLRIEHFMSGDRNAEFKYLTGLDDYGHFIAVFSTLGQAAFELNYYRPDKNCDPGNSDAISVYRQKSKPSLTPQNEFFLMLVKVHCNVTNKDLGFRFGISDSSVSRIIITWINFLYLQWKEINVWAPLDVTNKILEAKCKPKTPYTVIIDCTEVEIHRPKNPVSQQQTYSSYKSCNTVKVLVGMSPARLVSFVSDAYSGSISDKALFEKCGIMDLLKPGDVVLADRGFQIQDLLAARDVTLCIPDFVKNSSLQLEPHQIHRSTKISSSRIHIERIIGLAKTYTILGGPLSANFVPMAGRIIYICFMLVNFRNNIM